MSYYEETLQINNNNLPVKLASVGTCWNPGTDQDSTYKLLGAER